MPSAWPPALQVSNRDVEEDDYDRWQRHCKLSNREPVTRTEVQQAVSQIKEVRSSLVHWHVQGYWSHRVLLWGGGGLMLAGAGTTYRLNLLFLAAGAAGMAYPELILSVIHTCAHWHQPPCPAAG